MTRDDWLISAILAAVIVGFVFSFFHSHMIDEAWRLFAAIALAACALLGVRALYRRMRL